MKKFTINLVVEIDKNLSLFNEKYTDVVKLSEVSINYLLLSINKLKIYADKYKFKSSKEEIEFFKVLKPQIFSILKYLILIQNVQKEQIEPKRNIW